VGALALPAAPARAAGDAGQPEAKVAVGAFVPHATERPARLEKYVRRTGRRPAIILYYRPWEDGRLFDRATLRRVTRGGALPMVTWEPWDHPLRAIAAGRYDRYLRASAADARRWGRPILLRFAHEMNGDWYDWGSKKATPAEYVAAWKHVVRVFRQQRARNVRFAWTPNVSSRGGRVLRRYYPGDRWVDWVGLSGFSWGGPWGWQSFSEIFERSYRAVTAMTHKPFMIAETAASEVGGDKRAWIESTFRRELPRMPRVRAVVWFNGHDKWADWNVASSSRALKAFRAVVADPRYGAGPGDLMAPAHATWAGRTAVGRGR
jgi:hypothetical protein